MARLSGAASLLLAAFIAFAGPARAGEITVEGSSGKFFPEREAACAAAQGDASELSVAACKRENGEAGEPKATDCTCEQGGFEGAEWLCASRATVQCAVVAPVPVVVPVPEPAATGSAFAAPANPSALAVLSADFGRRGLRWPATFLEARYKAGCDQGWTLACDASTWRDAGAGKLEAAAPKLERACELGDANACIAFGWALEARAIAKSDDEHFRAAARRYKALCDDAKNQYACYEYGAILFNNLGVTTDPRLGVRRWESACEASEAAACTALARVNRAGAQNIKVDLPKAVQFASKACEYGDPYGCLEWDGLRGASADALVTRRVALCRAGAAEICWELSSGVTEPMVGGVSTASLTELACELGNGAACAGAGAEAQRLGRDDRAAELSRHVVGRALGLALLDGESLPRDATRARALLRQSCVDKNSPARPCYVLADLYERGAGGDRDRTLASQYYRWACGQGWAQACDRRGDLLHGGVGVRRDDAEAVADYQAACDAGLGGSCHKAAVILDEGSVVPRDPPRALELYRLGCERSVGEACLRLGRLHVEGAAGAKDEVAARDAFEKGVALKNVESHRQLARLLWGGLGGKKDKKRAKALCAAGCKMADPIACRGPEWQREGG